MGSASASASASAPATRLFDFVGGDSGLWRVQTMHAVAGEGLAAVACLDVLAADAAPPRLATSGAWALDAPDDAAAFTEMVGALRASPEWAYGDREVDIRLVRDAG